MRQGPDVRYEEVLRLVLLNVLELQVWQLGQPAKQSKNIWYEAKNKLNACLFFIKMLQSTNLMLSKIETVSRYFLIYKDELISRN